MHALKTPCKDSLLPNKSLQQSLILLLIILITVLLGRELYNLIERYSVNIIFWDQFDFMTPFFNKLDPWTMFTWQHGPHRQGLGELITWVVIQFSEWNTRSESFMILAVLLLSLPVTLSMKHKLIGYFEPIDLLIPIVILNKCQWEQLIQVPNVSHAVLPLLLVFIYACSWLIKNQVWRYVCVLLVSFLLLFTGFGIFIGIVTIIILLFELIFSVRQQYKQLMVYSIIGLAIAIVSLLIFSHGYNFSPAADCFGFNWSYIPRYPTFVGIMMAKFFGIDYSATPILCVSVGLLLLMAFIVTFGFHLRKYLLNPIHSDPIHKIIAILIGYSLLLSFFTAIGRICLGLQTAQSSRYMTFLIPGFIGLILSITKIKNPAVKTILSIFFTLMLFKTMFPLNHQEQKAMIYYSDSKTQWKECYLRSEDYLGCNESTGFQIYPGDPNRIVDRLSLLKENHQNLFLENR